MNHQHPPPSLVTGGVGGGLVDLRQRVSPSTKTTEPQETPYIYVVTQSGRTWKRICLPPMDGPVVGAPDKITPQQRRQIENLTGFPPMSSHDEARVAREAKRQADLRALRDRFVWVSEIEQHMLTKRPRPAIRPMSRVYNGADLDAYFEASRRALR